MAHCDVELFLLSAHKVLHKLNSLANILAHLLHLVQAVLIVLTPPPRLWPVYLLPSPVKRLS